MIKKNRDKTTKDKREKKNEHKSANFFSNLQNVVKDEVKRKEQKHKKMTGQEDTEAQGGRSKARKVF